jgi:CRISPR-associated protein Cmr2
VEQAKTKLVPCKPVPLIYSAIAPPRRKAITYFVEIQRFHLSLSDQDYRRKLFALLRLPDEESGRDGAMGRWGESILRSLHCWGKDAAEAIPELSNWWETSGKVAQEIGSSSDRVNLHVRDGDRTSRVIIRHPISGEAGTVAALPNPPAIPEKIQSEPDPQKVFWWFWRFYPELWLNSQSNTLSDGLLFPAHHILPDCAIHSYQATVSALTGARFAHDWQKDQDPEHPYLLIFTFSPIQDFIKASRKFLDFWAGSYLLHYLSARLCWHIAREYGPDAIIVPSLWGQDIVDTFLLEHYQAADEDFYQFLEESFRQIGDHKTPVDRFRDRSTGVL